MTEDTFSANVVLSSTEKAIVDRLVDRLGLGKQGRSAAVRIIIREWDEMKARGQQPDFAQKQAA